ncbi:hypothetical protein K227x_60180 [Rubripirellula lacrimiformis]|uniref:Uncharacterized protein n=1 Tax=Rubripirellula lacrimiformis TaxID=1930273 RepID=A0A517NKD6_9BACT|nr:hypothetical protein K227x_60180 [Rubripirellula lacrimiformis]
MIALESDRQLAIRHLCFQRPGCSLTDHPTVKSSRRRPESSQTDASLVFPVLTPVPE